VSPRPLTGFRQKNRGPETAVARGRERDDLPPELKALSVPAAIIRAPDSPLARRWRLRPESETAAVPPA
jgi:hypothetical protein